MRLYILRHGPAGESGDPRFPDDRQRPLTETGIERMHRAAALLTEREVHPTLIVTSPLVRCRQTAEILAAAIHPQPRFVEREELAPRGEIEPLIKWCNNQVVEEIVWVGHAPDVMDYLRSFCKLGRGSIHFAKGAMAAIDFTGDRLAPGRGTLRWLITNKMLGC